MTPPRTCMAPIHSTSAQRTILSRQAFKEPSEESLSSIKIRLIFFIRQPIVTGTSVLAIKYKDGIMMAADNLGESLSKSRCPI